MFFLSMRPPCFFVPFQPKGHSHPISSLRFSFLRAAPLLPSLPSQGHITFEQPSPRPDQGTQVSRLKPYLSTFLPHARVLPEHRAKLGDIMVLVREALGMTSEPWQGPGVAAAKTKTARTIAPGPSAGMGPSLVSGCRLKELNL